MGLYYNNYELTALGRAVGLIFYNIFFEVTFRAEPSV